MFVRANILPLPDRTDKSIAIPSDCCSIQICAQVCVRYVCVCVPVCVFQQTLKWEESRVRTIWKVMCVCHILNRLVIIFVDLKNLIFKFIWKQLEQ